MKKKFVAELKPDESVTSLFLVRTKEIRTTQAGKPYLRMELGDRTGSVETVMWDRIELAASQVQAGDIIEVKARVGVYKNKPQLSLDAVRLAPAEGVDLADFLPHTKEDVEKLYAELRQTAESLKNPWLRALTLRIIADPGIAARYKRAPAAKIMHHAYLGGLLEHVMSLCRLCRSVAAHYADLDLDLLLTAALLHDVGKLDELCYERAIGYTTEGQLLGHIVMELETVNRAMDAIESFPPAWRTVVQHVLISHHGQYEFGSPKLPMLREALIFHYLDDMDSKLAAARSALDGNSGDPEWSEWSPALERRFLRLDEFLKQRQSGEQGKAAEAGVGTAGPGLSK